MNVSRNKSFTSCLGMAFNLIYFFKGSSGQHIVWFFTDYVEKLDLALKKNAKADISKAKVGRNVIRLKMEILPSFFLYEVTAGTV